MTMKTIGVMIAFASLAIASASITSALTFANTQRSSGDNSLSGTSWQLVRFQAPDERIVTPDDKSKYTITFGSNGRVTARVDCNRASSTWKATANNQLQ